MNAQGFEIISATFERVEGPQAQEWAIHISAVALNIKHVALPFRARVGLQPVERLGVTANGDRFEGYLKELPRAGDRLYVGYGLASLPTNVVYQPRESRPRVA